MSGNQIYEILHKQFIDSLTPQELEESNKRMEKLLEHSSKYPPIDIVEAKKIIAESRGYQYGE
jgi:hypothetical protein